MSKSEYPEPDPTLSSDARHSTYEKAPQDEGYPPPGPATLQHKGKPTEAKDEKEAKASRSTPRAKES